MGHRTFFKRGWSPPSSSTWVDANGTPHTLPQGEGGEQGEPLMPGLYPLAAYAALHELQACLRDGRAVFALFDDVYVVAPPDRVRELCAAVEVAS